ncbi:MAG TPA: hypothetical protein VIY48_13240 [Candidatus Paceibacterota bacterium]
MKHLRGDWLKWVAAGFALAATASAEYELARAIGMDKVIAAAVPGALDAYVVRALRAHREVLTAVLAMVGVNAASHLVTAGVLAVDWRLITAVSAIAPLVLWRVHALGTPGQWRARKIWGVPKHVTVPDPDGHASTPVTGCVLAHPECAGHDACTVYEKPSADTFEEHASTALGVLDYVPREWVTPPVPEHAPDQLTAPCSVCLESVTFTAGQGWKHAAGSACLLTYHEERLGPGVCSVCFEPVTEEHGNPCPVSIRMAPVVPEHIPDPVPGWDGTITEHVPEKRERVLKAVPDLPDGYVHAGLRPGDDAYLEQARVLHARGTALRDWKPVLGVGTARAQRLRDYINSEHDASTEEST